jgi:triosephosphate isomerase
MCVHIRDTLAELSSPQAAERVRILYGGSVTPRNVAEVAALPAADGVLVGSGSVNAENFVAIARAFASARASA